MMNGIVPYAANAFVLPELGPHRIMKTILYSERYSTATLQATL